MSDSKDTLQQKSRTLEELGAELTREREIRGLTTDDISTMTCIRVHFIEDIEKGNFGSFVSVVYARGFVRTCLNLLQRQDLWPEYDHQLTSLSTTSTPSEYFDQPQEPVIPPGKAYRRRLPPRQCFLGLCCLVILGCCTLLWSNRASLQTDPSATPVPRLQISEPTEAEPAEEMTETAEAPAATEEAVPEAAAPEEEPVVAEAATLATPAAVPAETITPTLTVRATGDCWFELRQGSQTIRARIIRNGYEETFDLSEPIRVVFGAGGNVRVTVNGEDRGSPGNRVVRLEYRPDGTAVPYRNN